MPILSCQSLVRPATAWPATRTDLHVAPLRLHEFAPVEAFTIVWPRETGPGLRRGRPAAIDPAKADQRQVAHRLVVLGVVAVHDGPEELQRLANALTRVFVLPTNSAVMRLSSWPSIGPKWVRLRRSRWATRSGTSVLV